MRTNINKDSIRKTELNNMMKYREGWELSNKYSKILMNHIMNDNLYEISLTIYSQYMNELKNKKINTSKNYVQIWETMINTIRKGKSCPLRSIRILHQTSQQRTN